MNKEYILIDFDNSKFITQEIVNNVESPYEIERISDLSIINLFKLNSFILDDINQCEWYIKNFEITDKLNLKYIELNEALDIIKNHLEKNKEINQNLMEM